VRGNSKRPWLAAALALAYPGLGHVYLREWIRALLWLVLIVGASVLLFPAGATPTALSIEAFMTAAEAVPLYAAGGIAVLTALSMADAYALATRNNRAPRSAGGTLGTRSAGGTTGTQETTQSCPHCGKDLEDTELDFCQWCAEPLDETPDDDRDGVTPW